MLRVVSVWGVAAVLISSLMPAQQARAQGGRFGGRGFGGGMFASPSMLLRMPEVQKELGVTDEQKAKIEDLQKEARPAGSFNREEFQNLTQEEREKRMAEFRKKMEESNKKFNDQLKTVLEPKQIERLNQLRLQREGVMALNRPDVAKALNLTKEQQDQLHKIQEASRPTGERPNFRDLSEEERRELFTKMQKQREKTQADMLAVLTDEQKTKLAEMKGKEFKFPQGGFGRPGGGEQRRPGTKKRD